MGVVGGLKNRDRIIEFARSIMTGVTVEYAQHLSGGRRAETMRLDEVLNAAVWAGFCRIRGLTLIDEYKPNENDALVNSCKAMKSLLTEARRGQGLFQSLSERGRMKEFHRVLSNRLTLGFAKRLTRSGYGESAELVNGLLVVQLFVKACNIIDELVEGEPDSAATSSRYRIEQD